MLVLRSLILGSVLLGCVLFGGVGCRFVSTPIGRIHDDPRRFQGQSVTLSGRVEAVRWIPEVGALGFRLVDGADSILVLTQIETPAPGSQARCVGQISRRFPIGREHRVVLLDETTLGGRGGGSNPRSRRN